MSSARLPLLLCSIVLALAPLVAAVAERSPIERALYPNALPARTNEISNTEEVPELLLLSTATLSNDRQAAVWAERVGKELRFDKIYFVHVAVLERSGDVLRVLDQREITDDMALFAEFPGNAVDVQALATTFDARGTAMLSVELWSVISGTGQSNAANHLLFSVSPAGKLAPALKLEGTYAGGRDGGSSGAIVSTITVAAADLSVATRALERPVASSPVVQCGPLTTKRYHFNGTTYVEAGAGAPAANAITLPRLPFEEKASCAN